MVHAREVDGLLPIGEFSERCGLSPKMLRDYAARGLLTPAAIDGVTGYRFYATRQVHEAHTIALLRKAGVPLKAIASFLRSPGSEQLVQWEQDLEGEAITRLEALKEVRDYLGSTANATPSSDIRPPPFGGNEMVNCMSATASIVGRVREQNQDAVLVADGLFAVADGMGGLGEIASLLALEVLNASFAATRTADGLFEACRAANTAVWRRAISDRKFAGTGTTLAAVGLVSSGSNHALVIVNVGDSRAYLVHDDVARCVTNDHSLVGELVRAGELDESEARVHPQRPILTRALGVGGEVQPDIIQIAHGVGDRLLLCTDGLVNELEEGEIESILRSAKDPPDVAAELVEVADSRGGNDNISVVVVDFE